MKLRCLTLFFTALFCLCLVGCGDSVYPEEELVVKGGFDGAWYTYSDKVNLYLRYSGEEDHLIIKTSEDQDGWETNGYKVLSGEFSEAAWNNSKLFVHCGSDYYMFDIKGYTVGDVDKEKGTPKYTLEKYSDRDFEKQFPDYKAYEWYDH
ncbi:MAG: hypothetical protein UIH27_03525 [Ruminococcus sp.]|nr:hypothetical protein [Ruminococcus sp.]